MAQVDKKTLTFTPERIAEIKAAFMWHPFEPRLDDPRRDECSECGLPENEHIA